MHDEQSAHAGQLVIRHYAVLYQSPPHQQFISEAHPSGHGCNDCTLYFPLRVERRYFTRRAAQRRVDRLMSYSLRPGWWWLDDDD